GWHLFLAEIDAPVPTTRGSPAPAAQALEALIAPHAGVVEAPPLHVPATARRTPKIIAGLVLEEDGVRPFGQPRLEPQRQLFGELHVLAVVGLHLLPGFRVSVQAPHPDRKSVV